MTDINENFESEKTPIPIAQPLKGIGGWLLLFIIGTFLSAVINFLTAAQTGSASFLSGGNILVSNPYVATLLGLFALVTGIMLITVRNIYSVWVARAYMIMYLIGSIIIAITGLEAPSGYYVINEEGEIIRGIFSAILLNSIWQSYFFRSKRVKETYPKISEVQADISPQIGKTLTSLFDKQKYGINYYIGIGLFLCAVVGNIIYPLFYALWDGYPIQYLPASYYLAFQLPRALLESVLLVVLLHTLRNDWIIAIAMGLGTAIISFLMRVVFNNVSFGRLTITSGISVQIVIMNFLWSFITLLAIILALKTWGLKLWSFLAWFSICFIADGFISEIVNLIKYKEFTFNLSFLVIDIIDALFTAVIMYYSIYFFLKPKGISLNTKQQVV